MSTVHRVLIADPVSPECRALFQGDKRFEVVEQALRGEALIDAIGDFDALIVRSGCKVTDAVLAKAGRLKCVVRAGVGVDNIDIDSATRHGVLVMNTPEGNTISAAEHSLALMMALSRKIPNADRRLRSGRWRDKSLTGHQLYGKTLGIIGLGKIGREVAKRAHGFAMELLGFDPMIQEDDARSLHVKLSSLDEIFEQADFISVHVPLNDKTRGLINKQTMAKMKPEVRLINCARGGIINEADLVEALKAGQVAGAALDVFEHEPLAEGHPLSQLDNVVLTPHLGASTVEAQDKVGSMSGQQVRAYLLNGEIRNAINTLAFDAHEIAKIQPFIHLAQCLGSLHGQILSGAPKRITVRFAGAAFRDGDGPARHNELLTLSVMKGLFESLADGPVNQVSAPYFAKQKGIQFESLLAQDTRGYLSLLTVELESSQETRSISGTLIGDSKPRLVLFDKWSLDAIPEKRAVIFHNNDEPGMLGLVTTILGQAGINIANVTLGRQQSGGRALAFMNVDSEVSDETLDKLGRISGVPWVRVVNFEG